jgi:hypothetical protein
MKYLHPFIWLALSVPVLASACSSGSEETGSGANAIGGSPASGDAPKRGGSTPGTSNAGGPAPAAFVSANGFEVIFVGTTDHADGTSTWRYRVNETPCARDLSNWVLEVFDCRLVSASPAPNEFVRPDPNADLTGVKWETGDAFSSGEFSVTVFGAARAGTVRFAVKGPDVVIGETTGPRCGDAAAPPVDPRSKPRGNANRCPDASVPPSDAAPPPPPPPPPPPVDAGSDGPPVCEHTCSEESPCPPPLFCDPEGCCRPTIP